MFKKILIANRGEIACRIIKTARKMGISTVAIYSDTDRHACHVALADEAIAIGGTYARDSYLTIDTILSACKQTAAQAIHPGYGFLSEDPHFAQKTEEQGIVFIGPKHDAIAAMGNKITAKKWADKAGVHTIPGVNQAVSSAAHAVAIANKIGYPVMIKASSGGGGKGLRIAYKDQDALDGFIACQHEARHSFHCDDIFIEKFIEAPRHIEVQILGDAHGNIVHLWERECSIQRRHQKLVEEAPSFFLHQDTRQAMTAQAITLARAVGYQSAGTVEFIVAPDQSFYFLEMNTRLQVEHPVTEMITGQDIVELMIRIAAGEALPFTQADIAPKGWAIECRINAEDPAKNFLPSTGRLTTFSPPEDIAGRIRIDTGVTEGSEVSVFYDALLAKLIVHADDRAQAITYMRDALDAFTIRGVQTNISFQSALMAHPRFISGDFNTGLMAEIFADGFRFPVPPIEECRPLIIIAAAMHTRQIKQSTYTHTQLNLTAQPGPRINNSTALTNHIVIQFGTHHLPITIIKHGDIYRITLDGKSDTLRSSWHPGTLLYCGDLNGQAICMQVEQIDLHYRITYHGQQIEAKIFTPEAAALQKWMPVKTVPDQSKLLRAPMPGLLIDLLVEPGQKIKSGDKLAMIEAMKMENTLFATQDEIVDEVLVSKGDSVTTDQTIMRFK